MDSMPVTSTDGERHTCVAAAQQPHLNTSSGCMNADSAAAGTAASAAAKVSALTKPAQGWHAAHVRQMRSACGAWPGATICSA